MSQGGFGSPLPGFFGGLGSHFRHQRIATVRLVPAGSPVANHGFDVAPARLVSGLITERGCA